MQNVLEEIKTSPGVMGSCIFSAEQGILTSNLPTVFNQDTQNKIAETLHRIFKLKESVKLDVNSYEIQYDEALILVRRICDASSLVVLCDPDANIHPINMSISVLSSDLVGMIKDCRNTAPPEVQNEPEPTPEPEPVPVEESVDAETVINDMMAEEMTTIRKALAKAIGPIASMSLEEGVEDWLKQGAPSGDRLSELAERLLEEIDNEADRKEFMDDLQSIL